MCINEHEQSFSKVFLFYSCLSGCRYAHHVNADAYRDQKRALGPLKLELAAVVTHLIHVVETKQKEQYVLLTLYSF